MQTIEQVIEETEAMRLKLEQPRRLGEVMTRHVPSGMSKPNELPESGKQNGTHSPADKLMLLKILATASKLQKQYGQTAAELETLVDGFCMILSDYPMPKIIDAVTQYIRKHPDIPRPSDIENIINPPRPKPDWAVYVSLKKKIHDGYYPLSDERKFLRDCEDYAKERLQEEGDAYRQAQNEVDGYKRIGMYD